MNLDRDKTYTKIIDLDEIQNFVAQTFFIWNHLSTQIIDTMFRSKKSEFCRLLSTKMIPNEKSLNLFSYKFYLYPSLYKIVIIF